MYKKILKELDMVIVIPSRGRSDIIITHKIMPYATLVVPEPEYDSYRKKVGNDMTIICLPDSVRGLGATRNWVLDNFTEKVVFMIDDDTKYLLNRTKEKELRITYPDDIFDVVVNTTIMALDLGVGLYGYGYTGDIRKFSPIKPFRFNKAVGGSIGIIGRELRFNTARAKTDVDFCLKQLLKNRIFWVDDRYAFQQEVDSISGGSSLYRSREETRADVAE